MTSRVSLSGSLRLRLLIGTLAWIALAIAIAGWALGGLFQKHVAQQFNAQLTTHLDQLTAHLQVSAQGVPSLSSALSDPRFTKPYSGLYWQIDHVGSSFGLVRSRSLWDNVLKLPIDGPADGDVHQHRVQGPGNSHVGAVERVVTLDDTLDPANAAFRLVVAGDERQMEEPVARFNGMLWLALGLLGGGLALVAVIQVVIALTPLGRLRGALTAVRAGERQRLDGNFPGEVQPLVDEFNAVLAGNAEVVERARTQAGNLAHTLKTPLSVIANAASGQPEDFAQLISTQVDVARQHIDYHLSRSRVAASLCQAGVRTPVKPVIDGLMRVMQRIHAERNLTMTVRPMATELAFRGEEQDLQEMLGNLLDNACKWACSRVEVAAEITGDELCVAVDDDGCGIAEHERVRVLSRGERADEQVPGSGLGLAIVHDLAILYGGRLDLTDGPLGGLRAVLSLPQSAQLPSASV